MELPDFVSQICSAFVLLGVDRALEFTLQANERLGGLVCGFETGRVEPLVLGQFTCFRGLAPQDQRLQRYFECLVAIRTAQECHFSEPGEGRSARWTLGRGTDFHFGTGGEDLFDHFDRICRCIHVGFLGGQTGLRRAFAAQMAFGLHAVLNPDLMHVRGFATFIALHDSSIGLSKFFPKGCSQLAFPFS